jgi:hypothetical protein
MDPDRVAGFRRLEFGLGGGRVGVDDAVRPDLIVSEA